MTISSLFIRRPRLAFVVSTVITIAGLIALTALPVAQFPDIVPPQVRVSTVYPGASAQAVEESVAQVIEAQVNGVERMLYMKSTSGGDGSYAKLVGSLYAALVVFTFIVLVPATRGQDRECRRVEQQEGRPVGRLDGEGHRKVRRRPGPAHRYARA